MKARRFHSKHPFCDGRFHRLLEEAGLLNAQSGWVPFFVETKESILPGYLKSHSYGEYIFDWAWADYYQQMGLHYYPKIIHALPFTPINAPKVIGDDVEEVLNKSKEFYLENESVSGHHYLFTNERENSWLSKNGYLLKETLQYHFKNTYKDFDDFLSHLKMRKRKNILKERKAVADSSLKIKWVKDNEIDAPLMKKVYELYLSTIDKKQSYAYLNKDFFRLLYKDMQGNLHLALAFKNDELIAMSLFIEGDGVLYGRYWGIKPTMEMEYPFLHFELCYYQGMEFCFEHQIELFEAGAQGEHKLLRGFEPVCITSFHHLRLSQCHQAIKRHLEEHNAHNRLTIEQLKAHLPFKR